MNIKTKTNGYKAEGIQEMIGIFEKAAAAIFPDCEISHFYYGDYLDMADIGLGDGNYAHFDIRATGVRLNGYCAKTNELARNYEKLTHNDELYNGCLFELAGRATA